MPSFVSVNIVSYRIFVKCSLTILSRHETRYRMIRCCSFDIFNNTSRRSEEIWLTYRIWLLSSIRHNLTSIFPKQINQVTRIETHKLRFLRNKNQCKKNFLCFNIINLSCIIRYISKKHSETRCKCYKNIW